MKVGLGCKICLKTCCDSWDRRDRGMWTSDRETVRRETVTLENAEAMNKKMEERKKEGKRVTLKYEGVTRRRT
jgi:hypothetical protein